MFYQKIHENERFITVLLFLFVAIVSYCNILSGEFIWDDHCLIVDNLLIRHWDNFGRIFSSELHQNSFTNYYRPLQVLSYMIEYPLFKVNPAGYHAVNIFLHFLAGVLLFSFLKNLTHRHFLSATVGLLFIVHPINVSAVAYISGRADLLAAVFIFSSLVFYLKAFYTCTVSEYTSGACPGRLHLDDSSPLFLSKKKSFYFLLSLFMGILALLSKETAAALPFAICGLDILFLKRKNRLKRIGLYFVVVLMYLCARLTFLNFSSGNPFFCKKGFAVFDVGFFARCAIFFKTLLIYVGSIFIPVNLHMERIIAREHVYMFHYAGILLCLLLCFYVFKKVISGSRFLTKLFIFGIFWFFVWLMGQSAFVLPKIMADHFLYLSSIGIFLIIAIFVEALRTKKIVVTILCLYFCSFTWLYTQIWNNELSFFQWTVRHASSSYKVHDCLADLYLRMDRPDDAIAEYKTILSESFGIVCDKDIAILAQKTDSFDLKDQKREIASSVFYNLGVVYVRQGKLQDARVAYLNALKLNPETEQVYNNLGLLYVKTGDLRKAEEMYKKAIDLNGCYVQAYNNLAVLYAQRGDYDRAIIFWKEVLMKEPDYEMAKANISLAKEFMLEKAGN
ncbi:MAG: tetratricopeptide repeat protein [Candidatus Omnitrophota bacterium]